MVSRDTSTATEEIGWVRVKAAAWSSEHAADPKVISDNFKTHLLCAQPRERDEIDDDGNPVLRSPFRSRVAYFDSSDVDDDDVINSLSRSTLDGVKDVKLINGSRDFYAFSVHVDF